MNIEKNNTVFCDRYLCDDVNDLLGEIFRRLEVFIRIYGYSPTNLLLKFKDYQKIKKEKENVISTKNNQDYILCMKVNCI